jgi:hypothetical protein
MSCGRARSILRERAEVCGWALLAQLEWTHLKNPGGSQLPITPPDDIGLTEREIKQELAIALYQCEMVSLAKAATIASMTRLDFQRLIASMRSCYSHRCR